ncbi:SAM-dependent methyltransferase [Seonamhaeicola sp. S2-3]|uniref:class I SAM-dependent methyltransferase n=1 Tax=Seonamhaeicola sp. S2-3 TaxID=1936081 RepID=UPI00097273AD|nr:class I SAM-dependent methyltransferase [Seonamhaeicola sp. S2-3]APY12713.1 SAM-dependent methyltransferase [Seonamhaeicola sp. S2-3]
MEAFWNNRYKEKEFAYGTAPNQFFKESINKLKIKGTILLPAEGEGRNAVYAAKKGLKVTAFDISVEGKNKAEKLANNENVQIDYKVGELHQLDFKPHSFDLLALIYAHFPKNKKELHQKLSKLIKPNGYIILEGFSVKNLSYREKNPNVGGPADVNMLFTKEEMTTMFANFETLLLEQKEIELNEGDYHNGVANVIRYIGRKKR